MIAKEIIQKFQNNLNVFELTVLTEFGYTENQIIHLMKEYATLCCEAQRIACANNAKADYCSSVPLYSEDFNVYIDEDSILNTPITLL